MQTVSCCSKAKNVSNFQQISDCLLMIFGTVSAIAEASCAERVMNVFHLVVFFQVLIFDLEMLTSV